MTRHTSWLVWSGALVALFAACAESQQNVVPGDASAGGTSGLAGAAGAAGQSGAAGTGGSAGGTSDASDASDDQTDSDATLEDVSDVFVPDGPDGVVTVPGLGAFYAFEEATGSVFDISGNSNHGTVEGTGVNRGFAGLSGNAISFIGGDGRVNVPTSPSLDFTTGATIEFWIKLTSVTSGTIIGRGTGLSDKHVRVKTAQGNVNVAFGQGVGIASVISDANVLQTGIWTHVAVVNDGSQIRVYINGDVNKTGGGGQMGAINAALFIGKGAAGTDTAVNGTLDEVRWFNVVRTDQEICTDAGFNPGTVDGATVCN